MGTWWVTTFGLFFTAVTALAAPKEISVQLGRTQRVVLDPDLAISLVVTPQRGDAWSRLSLRVTGRASNWKTLAELNHSGSGLQYDREVRVPLAMLRPELQRGALQALFPRDRAFADGWVHQVVWEDSVEGESLWRIAEWFTGDGANYAAIRSANSRHRLSTRPGEAIVIPRELLLSWFRVGDDPMRIAEAEDDPADSGGGRAPASGAVPAVDLLPVSEPAALEYGSRDGQPYAVYRLRKGEALYSSVAIRFTGRVYAVDVNEVVDRIVRFNGIADVSKIPAGYPVKIPMELLLAEYRPATDPRRIADEQSRRESARLARRTEARGLKGVTVILDAGHGGRDVGTWHDGLSESDYVYDVACRIKALLEKTTRAKVFMTTRSKELQYSIPRVDLLRRHTDHTVLTSPEYPLEDSVVGVHLRWYLANSIFNRALDSSASPEKVIFLSIHADSLHPSLRGAMVYVPGQRYVQGTYSKRDAVYLARSEVREHPSVTQTEEEALKAEGLSTEFAESILGAFRDGGLQVHPFNPIRDNVVRDGREWVPAVIRYNEVPTRVLLEICNLGNEEDRRQVRTRKYRQDVAEAIASGILSFYSHKDESPNLKVAETLGSK